MLPMSRDRRAISPPPSRAWRFVARANIAFQRGPRLMGQRDPPLIRPRIANRRGKRTGGVIWSCPNR
jgi:hypothetical protein